VYYNLGRRYRGPGILLLLMGLLLFLPSFISELENDYASPNALAGVGVVVVLVGVAFLLFARLAIRRSYVEVNPDLLVIRTPFYRVLFSYRRIKLVQSVQVSRLYPKDSLKGMGKPLMRPLLPKTGLEVQVKSWPAPKKRLQRFLSQYLFSPRTEGWLFVVPDYRTLTRQIDSAINRKLEADQGKTGTYEDPIDRLKYFDT